MSLAVSDTPTATIGTTSPRPVHVTVTGAAGQIGYSLLFRIASGQLLGPDQPLVLRLLEIEPGMKALEGVVMEIDDCAFPLVSDMVTTTDLDTAFDGTSWALLVGSVPRKAGMERGDLLTINGGIFGPQGRAIAANAACMVVKDYAGVCVLRALVGVTGGLLTALYSAVLANSRSPGRIIAVTTFIQIGVEAAFMFSTTSVFARLGSSGLFILMAALFAALLPFLSWLPPAWPSASTAAQDIQGTPGSRRAYPLLFSFIPFIVVQTGVYTFLGEFGRIAASLPVDVTLRAIGASVVLSSLGSVAAYALNDRIGLRLPIGGAISDLVSKRKLDAETIADIEDVLIRADLGLETSRRIADALGEGRHDAAISADEGTPADSAGRTGALVVVVVITLGTPYRSG